MLSGRAKDIRIPDKLSVLSGVQIQDTVDSIPIDTILWSSRTCCQELLSSGPSWSHEYKTSRGQ